MRKINHILLELLSWVLALGIVVSVVGFILLLIINFWMHAK